MLRITCPPITHACHFGVNMGHDGDLMAARLTVDEMRDHIGADSLAFLSLDGEMRGIVLGAGSTQEELVVPVALGAKILTRTVAPLRSSPERLGIEWEGVLVWSWWGGEPRMNVLVPPGEIRVRWWALEDGVERLVHEERRRVGAGEEASVEYVAPE